MKKGELIVSKIMNGTVIDHIPAGRATVVLGILGIDHTIKNRISMVINAESKSMGKKDIVKIENRELKSEEADTIALVAPEATINIIRNYEVAKKMKIKVPESIARIIKCPNPLCITNNDVEAASRFAVISKNPIILKCEYCGTEIDDRDALNALACG